MARGGKRDVSPATPPGGPGALSRRTDGQQPLRSGKLGDPGVEFGDVQDNLNAQRVAPLPTAAGRGADVAPAPRTARALRGERGVPDFVFSKPTQRPNVPIQNGLTRGPGMGPEALDPELRPDFATPDDRELVLEYLATHYDNPAAHAMLEEIQNGRAMPAPLPMPTGAPDPGDPELDEDIFAGEGALLPGEVMDDMNTDEEGMPVEASVPGEPEMDEGNEMTDEAEVVEEGTEEPVIEGEVDDAEVVEDAPDE